ncbi:ArsR/SmtB family transcription factor [Streptomyces sp. CA-135486]|uniref:ArsR/SmtB family transcription factor n=1 Tax=Streptomyces sp. CA-135486 TaxID=3240049 RepID=UPI003D90B198
MLRIHFGSTDLSSSRMASRPDPLWEIACSLHRFQTARGRWAYADWFRTTRAALTGTPLGKAVRTLLIPLFPRTAYFPDFLTPQEGAEGLNAALQAIIDTPAERVRDEIARLDHVRGAPPWAHRLTDKEDREQLVTVLRSYHEALIAPYGDQMQAAVDAERCVRARTVLDAGTPGLLQGPAAMARWTPPALEVEYTSEDRDLYLDGRGLRLVPSYFCWREPISFADPQLPPVLLYALQHPAAGGTRPSEETLAALLGRTRAAILCLTAEGATTSELARLTGISPASASHHTTVLRDAGLVTSRRHGNTVLHTLTPTGAALLRRPPTARESRHQA